jgi:rhodanese-related sulfurtransferase
MFIFELVNGVPEVTAQEFQPYVGKVRLIDVRGADEFHGELGHIPGAELVTLGPELQQFLESNDREQALVFVCRSGGRSGRATMYSHQIGYQNTYNLQGGMLRWNELNLPVER